MSPAASRKPVEDVVSKVNDEVAVGEDLGFQRSWWRFERVLWMLFLGIIALDLAGVLGRGPIAHAQATSADGSVKVSYERIQRTGTPSILSVTLEGSAVRGGEATLFVSDDLVGALGARRIIPEPATTRLGDGGFTYTFPIVKSPAIVRFELEPSGPGRFPFEISARPRAGTVGANVWVVP